MIDELKLLLDQMKNVPDVALWILGGFLVYKLVTYLSLTGSVVYIIKVICEAIIKHKATPKNIEHKARFNTILIDKATEDALCTLFDKIRGHSMKYVHESDIRKLSQLWDEHKIATKKAA